FTSLFPDQFYDLFRRVGNITGTGLLKDRTAPERLGDSINYWWGISSGMIDIIYSKSLPPKTRQLAELVKQQIVSGNFQIFSGELKDQDGNLRCGENEGLSPTDIVRMDWLADNVEGGIPETDALTEEAAAMVEIQGIHTGKVFL
ncbi:MAG: BMP family ABC transporter substrate-binding protein, partial [Lachnospiraceae bacterium]|nr:BMP family ABC transporter substrate-binding protein [Lachnospiraceae bacterium]